jgi:hypothetical protein
VLDDDYTNLTKWLISNPDDNRRVSFSFLTMQRDVRIQMECETFAGGHITFSELWPANETSLQQGLNVMLQRIVALSQPVVQDVDETLLDQAEIALDPHSYIDGKLTPIDAIIPPSEDQLFTVSIAGRTYEVTEEAIRSVGREIGLPGGEDHAVPDPPLTAEDVTSGYSENRRSDPVELASLLGVEMPAAPYQPPAEQAPYTAPAPPPAFDPIYLGSETLDSPPVPLQSPEQRMPPAPPKQLI